MWLALGINRVRLARSAKGTSLRNLWWDWTQNNLGVLTRIEGKRVSKQVVIKQWESTRINQIPFSCHDIQTRTVYHSHGDGDVTQPFSAYQKTRMTWDRTDELATPRRELVVTNISLPKQVVREQIRKKVIRGVSHRAGILREWFSFGLFYLVQKQVYLILAINLKKQPLVVCEVFRRVLCFELCASQRPSLSVSFTANRNLTKFT